MKNHQKGSAALWVVLFIILVIAIAGIVLVMKNRAVTSQNQSMATSDNSVANTVNQTVASNGTWSSNLCDYFTLAIAQSNLTTPVVFDTAGEAIVSTSLGCSYVEQSNTHVEVALFTVPERYLPANALAQTISSMESSGTTQSIQGVGDEAFYIPGPKELYFVKSGTLAEITVDEPGGTAQQDLQEAENIARAIVPKLP